MTRVRGIRGATTADSNTRQSISLATQDLLTRLVDANEIELDDIAAALFTTTEDLNAGFPAEAAREMGWEYVALLCGHEMRVPDSLARCIRVLLLVNTERSPCELQNLYLKGAKGLRATRGEEV